MKRTPSILLVDDDFHVRQALGEVLATENYDVSLAANGDEAIRQLRQPEAPAIGAVLLDLMSGPENGWAIFRRLARLNPALPVIVLTSRRDQKAAAAAHRCVALMQKPLDLPLLCKTLRSVTAGREPASPSSTTGSNPLEEQGGSAT
jgi:DNA-binding response OmpR family regulator